MNEGQNGSFRRPLESEMRLCVASWLLLAALSHGAEPGAGRTFIESGLVHLRSGAEREWADFPEAAADRKLERRFTASRNDEERTLLIRQQDVKQGWNVLLNGKKVGELVRDENDMVIALGLPAGSLTEGENVLRIEPVAGLAASDDVRVGECILVDKPRQSCLEESTVEVSVRDESSSAPTPARLTILNADGAMQSVGASSNDHLAVRSGTVYTSTGLAKFGVPAGKYTVSAGRGFEYSLARAEVTVEPGAASSITLTIRREVPTEGYVVCDTHSHTLTHSGHGDATIDERMVTLAGEGIELPIATDHNKHISYEEVAVRLGVRKYFTPVTGNEVTTPRGHFNIFPIAADAKVVDHKQTDWALLFNEIEQTPNVKVAILNHARDLHSGVRPFGPENHLALVGENLHGWPLRFNAMEVINSGATQTDPLQLCHDWMGLLNRGLNVTPVGSSDSHDVSRHFVGQGRTYIRVDDSNPEQIDVDKAIASFQAGRVQVSYGLLTEVVVNGRSRSGELATDAGNEITIAAQVLGPHWVRADRVVLFANGQPIREVEIPAVKEGQLPPGVKWKGEWKIPRPAHDVHLVAIATGPGIDGLYWRTAKPYQPTSPDPRTIVFGCSGAVWVDADRDGQATPARSYAEKLVEQAGGDWEKLVGGLRTYDGAVAAQAAQLVGVKATIPEDLAVKLQSAAPATRMGFEAYAAARRESEIARGR
jgi:hypothetical protein